MHRFVAWLRRLFRSEPAPVQDDGLTPLERASIAIGKPGDVETTIRIEYARRDYAAHPHLFPRDD